MRWNARFMLFGTEESIFTNGGRLMPNSKKGWPRTVRGKRGTGEEIFRKRLAQ
jgi:hypothetical protein